MLQTSNRRVFLVSSLSCACFALSAGSAWAAGSLCAMTRSNPGGRRGTHPGSSAADKDADDVFEALGLGRRTIPIFASYEVENAAAFPNLNNAGPAIVYNPDFMTRLYNINDWAPASVIAHEIGHHVARDRGNSSSHRRELAADEVSGCAMAWMGASRQQATVAMTKGLPVNAGSPSHPGTDQRVQAITQAYSECGNLRSQ